MSMAPANRASMAEGPALKLFHSTLAAGRMAFSNQPLALPTMACACVMLGKAPTRMTTSCPRAEPMKGSEKMKIRNVLRIFICAPVARHHGKDAAIVLLARAPASLHRARIVDDVGQACAFQDSGSSVSHLEKDLVERAMGRVPVDLFA